MKQIMKCPICGKHNNREYYMEECWGAMVVSENYYTCEVCGYAFRMCYSEYVYCSPKIRYLLFSKKRRERLQRAVGSSNLLTRKKYYNFKK